MGQSRKYEFKWELLGDIEKGRPNLGNTTRLEVYRLMQYTLRDVLEQRYGDAEADAIFREAGRLSGKEFYHHLLSDTSGMHDFIRKFQETLRELGIGILRVEEADEMNGSFTLTVAEDLDCSGLPELDYPVCTFDEGFIGGILEEMTGKEYEVREVDCWCTGDRTCRFEANVRSP